MRRLWRWVLFRLRLRPTYWCVTVDRRHPCGCVDYTLRVRGWWWATTADKAAAWDAVRAEASAAMCGRCE